ncbi:hypothetical protein B566_EDAN003116 [Ephemera danica]|nr:hypothetical protein B566_EDAN003116 [Ephemera danica]
MDIPFEISLPVMGKEDQHQNTAFHLSSVVNHNGELTTSGHYTCDVVVASNKEIIHFDDSEQSIETADQECNGTRTEDVIKEINSTPIKSTCLDCLEDEDAGKAVETNKSSKHPHHCNAVNLQSDTPLLSMPNFDNLDTTSDNKNVEHATEEILIKQATHKKSMKRSLFGRKAQQQGSNSAATGRGIKRRKYSTLRSKLGNEYSTKAILTEIGLEKKTELTPKKLKIIEKLNELRKNLKRYIHLAEKYKGEVGVMKSNEDSKLLEQLELSLSPTMCTIILKNKNLRNVDPRGRRWSNQEKIDMLCLHKASPKSYRCLRQHMTLPHPSTLNNLLSSFHLKVGINPKLFEELKKAVQQLHPSERFCVLQFDEMKIKEFLELSNLTGSIIGYEDFGTFGRTHRVATHVLLFVLRGINCNWKLPIEYVLCHKTTPSQIIFELLKELLRILIGCGLIIMATSCDQGSTNKGAYKLLGATAEKPYFILDGIKIFSIYDTIHLFKSFRNNCRRHDFYVQGERKKSCVSNQFSWKYIYEFYKLDKKMNRAFRYAPKLRNIHFKFKWKKTQKVNLAVQLFSHSVATGMMAMIEKGMLTADAKYTALCLEKLNKLFDSTNSKFYSENNNKYKNPLSESSPHIIFWKRILRWFESMNFKDNTGKNILTRINYMWTIRALIGLWERMKEKGFTEMRTRDFNTDPTENINSQIRYLGGCNPEPTSSQYESALKILLLKKNIKIDVKHSNCEDDGTEMLFEFGNLIDEHFVQEESIDINSAKELFVSISPLDEVQIELAQSAMTQFVKKIL